MASLWRSLTNAVTGTTTTQTPDDYGGISFWVDPERTGYLTKQGEYIKTWRRRWFVLKQGKLFWFKDSVVSRASIPRGVIPVSTCLTVKGAEDVLNKQFAFELSTSRETMYFIADTEKDKEEWINSIGRSIVQHSRSVTEAEVVDYDHPKRVSVIRVFVVLGQFIDRLLSLFKVCSAVFGRMDLKVELGSPDPILVLQQLASIGSMQDVHRKQKYNVSLGSSPE
ncbi:hypothetical protein GIB67_036800 [Kingdonia uniflora]|uniref:PH domain-containing protein n=1 Tax=Kingdonia uniflora TaxID=39325 RepID=A0A7J7LWP2_9MAGN|nr:hypothetical protein GIB67_036800 [Kingdonia uniflora]